MSSEETGDNQKEFLNQFDEILHKIINNQQAVLGRAELMMERSDLAPEARDELKLILQMIGENNELVVRLRRKLRQELDT